MTEMGRELESTVLLVEDDDQVRTLIRTLLTAKGFRVLEASTGAEGLQLADRYGNDIDLLLSDMLLPQISGYDLAVQLRERNPHLCVVFMTGYVEGEIVQRGLAELQAGFLDKPFQPADLINTVKRSLLEARRVPGPQSASRP